MRVEKRLSYKEDAQCLKVNKYTNCKGVKNNTNFEQITGIHEKLDKTRKYNASQ